MARIDEMKAELADVRQRLSEARKAASLSIDGRSLTRQGMTELEDREAVLTYEIESFYRGSSFGRTVFRRT